MNSRVPTWFFGTHGVLAYSQGSLQTDSPAPKALEVGGDKKQNAVAGRFFAVSLWLVLIEAVTSWYVVAQIFARAMVGLLAYMSLIKILPPELALYQAQRMAVSDLL